MLRISEKLKEILESDQEAYIACQRGLLNLSAYAREIKKDLERQVKKTVNLKSVIVALSRLKRRLGKIPSLGKISEQHFQLSLHSNLAELTYEKTAANLAVLKEVYQQLASNQQTYLTATQGLGEITIIGETQALAILQNHLKASRPLFKKNDLAGITVKFPASLIDTPNLIFFLLKKLAIKKINIIELISTFTEITFIVERKDALEAIKQLED